MSTSSQRSNYDALGGLPRRGALNRSWANEPPALPAADRSDRPLRRRQLAVDGVAGVRRALRLDQENVRLLVGTGPMFDAARHDEQIARPQLHGAIAELDLELAF